MLHGFPLGNIIESLAGSDRSKTLLMIIPSRICSYLILSTANKDVLNRYHLGFNNISNNFISEFFLSSLLMQTIFQPTHVNVCVLGIFLLCNKEHVIYDTSFAN